MTYWLLILILLTPAGHIKDIYYVEPPNGRPLKSIESCVEAQELARPHQPKGSILWCYHMNVPEPPHIIPIKDLKGDIHVRRSLDTPLQEYPL